MSTKLKEKLTQKNLVLTAELTPPKGTNISPLRRTALKIKDQVDAITATCNARAKLKMPSLAICQKLNQWGIEPILQLNCRDSNQLALQGDLLAASSFGIHNTLYMYGDPPILSDQPNVQGVFELDTTDLVKITHLLNQGFDYGKNHLDGATQFFPGCTLSPCSPDQNFQLNRLEQKIEVGAQYFITQAVFDSASFLNFFKKAQEKGFKKNPPVIAGIFLIESAKTANFINLKIPGASISKEQVEKLEKASNPWKIGFDIAFQTIEELKKHVQGFHIMAVQSKRRLPVFINELKRNLQ